MTLGLIIFAVMLYQTAYWGSVSTDSSNILVIDGKMYKQTEVKLRPGKYQVEVANPVKTSVVRSLRIWPTNSTKLSNNNPSFGVTEVIDQADFSVPDKYFVLYDYRFFDNNNWLAAKYKSTSPRADGFTSIFKYNPLLGWKVYNTGTGFGSQLKDSTPELFRYISGGS